MARKSEYKPLLLTTTVRNPERYKALLNVLLTYNGQILTNEIIDKIIFEFVKKKLYVPMHAMRTPRLKAQLAMEDVLFSDEDTKEIIDNSPQDHKEAGFDKGWASRFDTFYKLAMELGFVYYEMNKPIEVSESGMKLIKSLEPDFRHLEQQVFLNAFSKYQRCNPFRRVLNTNKPLILLLQTIQELKHIYGANCAGITRQEISLLLCWRDSNAIALANRIKHIRDECGFAPSDEYIYDICKELLDATNEKRFKLVNIMREMPDEYIRKMRSTGLVSLRGNGRFIDFNSLENEKINYVLTNATSQSLTFISKRAYYDYMKIMDNNLISLEAVQITSETEKERLFNNWVSIFDIDTLKSELRIVCSSRAYSRNDVLKFISEPVRLEFLTALALKKAFPSLHVTPNYVFDDEGIPTSCAPGGGADIVCCDSNGNILFEVTLLTGTQQNIREMPAIARHLRECAVASPNSFSVMICPRVHADTREYAAFIKHKDNLDIAVLEIAAFVETLGDQHSVRKYITYA